MRRGRVAKEFTIGREASSGRFVSIESSDKLPSNVVKERVPRPGYGDTRRDAKTGEFLSQEPVTKREKVTNAQARRAVDAYRSGKK
jgi:hypothetical protein